MMVNRKAAWSRWPQELVRWEVRERVLQVKGAKVGMPTVFGERKSPTLCVGRNGTRKCGLWLPFTLSLPELYLVAN